MASVPGSHMQYGDISIWGAESIEMTWTWEIENTAPTTLYAGQKVVLRHDTGWGIDEFWVKAEPGLFAPEIKVDFAYNKIDEEFRSAGAIERGQTNWNPNPDYRVRSEIVGGANAQVPASKTVSLTSTLRIPGPEASAGMAEGWERETQGENKPNFHLELTLFQLTHGGSGIGDPNVVQIKDHTFKYLWSANFEILPLRVNDLNWYGQEQPRITVRPVMGEDFYGDE